MNEPPRGAERSGHENRALPLGFAGRPGCAAGCIRTVRRGTKVRKHLSLRFSLQYVPRFWQNCKLRKFGRLLTCRHYRVVSFAVV